jgi:hypothetical protein
MQSAYGGQEDWTVTTITYAFIDDYLENYPNNCLAIHQDVSQASNKSGIEKFWCGCLE